MVRLKLSRKEIRSLVSLIEEDGNIKKYDLSSILKKLKSHSKRYTMFVDGAADLHSKTAGIGGVIYQDDVELFTFSKYLDGATNNEAEYESLIFGLESLQKLSITNVNIFSDSELVVKQINGLYKVKNDRMKNLHKKSILLLSKLENWSFNHVLRDKNKVADSLASKGRMNPE